MPKQGDLSQCSVEHFVGKRFDEVVVGSKLPRSIGELVFASAADDDHRRRIFMFVRVNFGQQFHTTDVRHLHVAEYCSKLLRFGDL